MCQIVNRLKQCFRKITYYVSLRLKNFFYEYYIIKNKKKVKIPNELEFDQVNTDMTKNEHRFSVDLSCLKLLVNI